MASPPFDGSNTWKPNRRSSSRRTFAIDRLGSANTTANEVASMLHTYSGMRLMDMPGARILKMVTMKLMAPTVVEMLRNSRLRV